MKIENGETLSDVPNKPTPDDAAATAPDAADPGVRGPDGKFAKGAPGGPGRPKAMPLFENKSGGAGSSNAEDVDKDWQAQVAAFEAKRRAENSASSEPPPPATPARPYPPCPPKWIKRGMEAEWPVLVDMAREGDRAAMFRMEELLGEAEDDRASGAEDAEGSLYDGMVPEVAAIFQECDTTAEELLSRHDRGLCIEDIELAAVELLNALREGGPRAPKAVYWAGLIIREVQEHRRKLGELADEKQQ